MPTETQTEPKKRQRLGVMVKAENLEAIKSLNATDDYKSEGSVVDHAIERLVSHIERRKRK